MTRNPHAGTPFTDSDAAIEAALAQGYYFQGVPVAAGRLPDLDAHTTTRGFRPHRTEPT